MFFEDHIPPHVHVVGREFEMLVAIRNGAILDGKAPPQVRRIALRWIAENREALLTKWKELR